MSMGKYITSADIARLIAKNKRLSAKVKNLKEEAKQQITEYWLKFYAKDHCTLCGNHGWIDSRGVSTPAEFQVGRVNWCICPNGQSLRDQIGGFGPDTEGNHGK
jgi:hypothetical protein